MIPKTRPVHPSHLSKTVNKHTTRSPRAWSRETKNGMGLAG